MDVEFVRYQFEDGHYGVITKSKLKIGIRHIQMLYMFASSIAMGIMRATMGVAVLAINDYSRRNDNYITIHSWNTLGQGIVLSSFFIGYALLLLPSEIYLKKIGGKWLTTFIFLFNGVLCVAMPTIVNKGGLVAVCNANLFMGMTHGCFYVVNKSLMDKWLPPNERQTLNHVIFGGIQIGIVVGLPVSGMLTTAALGWELVYYALGIMALSMAVLIGTLTASSPDDHQAVGDAEKEYLRNTLQYYRKKNIRKPWRDILRSLPFWAVTCAHAASNALFIFFLVYSPAYLMNCGMSLKDSAFYSMVPFLSMAGVYITVSSVIHWVTKENSEIARYSGIQYLSYVFSASFLRKNINVFGASGIVIGLTMLPNLSHEWDCSAIILLAVILGLLGFQFCGFLSSFKDMSENFSGTVMMLSCSISSAVGGCVPLICGFILRDHVHDPSRWRPMLLLIASLYILCTLIYTGFGSHDRQHWDHVNDKKHLQRGHLNAVMDVDQIQSEENGYTTYVLHKIETDTAL